MSNIKSGLGKGFDSLIPTDFDKSLLMETGERIQNISVTDIVPNPDQPRRHFDDEALGELAQSIKRYGVLQPIIVSPTNDGSYVIIAGERRWRASQIAGLDTVPVIVRNREELEQLEIALIENVQRVDLSPLEQAISIERLHQQFNISYGEVAKRLGKADTTVSNIVRLLQLPPIAREALQAGLITEGHARAVLALKGEPELQEELLNLIQKHNWSVRQAEQFVSSHKQGASTKEATRRSVSTETDETKRIGKRLGAKVSVRRTARGGRLEIHFKSDEQLALLLDKLK